MHLDWKTYTCAKSGNRPDENEDACFPREGVSVESKEFRCALSDGATSTSFSKKWAASLVEGSVNDYRSIQHSLSPILTTCQEDWRRHVNALDLPWHALQKSEQGAFATLLWFRATQTGYSNRMLGRWQALAVGDTCFFHLRDGKLQAAFPVQKAAELSNHPYLLSSVEQRNQVLWKNNPPRKAQGAFEGGDEFLFMTDALAGWFLIEMEEGRRPQDALSEVLTAGETKKFDDLLNHLRRAGAIKNDDSTLAYLKIRHEELHVQEKGWN